MQFYLFIIAAFVSVSSGIFIDPLTESPNIYQPQSAVSACLSVIKDGSLQVSQNFGTFRRTTTLTMTEAENFDMLGHELCISNGYLSKSSGPAGLSYFNVEYEYTPPILVNTALEPILLRLRIDLPVGIYLYSTLHMEQLDMVDSNATVSEEVYNLGEFMTPFTDTTFPLFTSLNGTYLVYKFQYKMLPPENNVDLRISYPKPTRTNYLQYRLVVSNPYTPRSMYAVDGNSNTTWDTTDDKQSNLTITFPSRLLSGSTMLAWSKPPKAVELGYFDMDKTYHTIQRWVNKRTETFVIKRNKPKESVDNLHLIVTGTASLSEIKYL
jgi:hypothetical protein